MKTIAIEMKKKTIIIIHKLMNIKNVLLRKIRFATIRFFLWQIIIIRKKIEIIKVKIDFN